MGLFKKNKQLEELKAKLKEINSNISLIGMNPTLKALPNILKDNETIEYATTGSIGNTVVLLLATNNGFYALQRDPLGMGGKTISIPLNKINDIVNKSGMAFSKFMITNGSNTYKIHQLATNDADKLTKTLQAQMSKGTNENHSHPAHIDSADEIIKYKNLLDSGAITRDEFEAKKKQLLNL